MTLNNPQKAKSNTNKL